MQTFAEGSAAAKSLKTLPYALMLNRASHCIAGSNGYFEVSAVSIVMMLCTNGRT